MSSPVQPELLRPRSYEEAAQQLREACARGNVTIRGSAARDAWFPPARDAVAELSSQALTGVVRYTPADLTICVRAGTPLEDVQAELSRERQRLPLDPSPAGTVGGAIAANDNGPLRTRWGGVRDALIGVRIALPNGEVARFGGDVVKNVAGYDLTKAYVGSAGAFGMIVEATFKVQPLPAAMRARRATGSLSALRRAAAALRARELPFAALELAGTTGDEPWHLDALAEGEPEVVERLEREFEEAVRAAGLDAVDLDAAAIAAQAARPAAAAAWMRVGVPRAATFDALDALPPRVEVIARPSAGICELFGEDGDAGALERYAQAILQLDGHVHLRLGNADLRARFGWWRAREQGGRRLFAMLKTALDPEQRCNAGRTIYDSTEEG